MTKIYLEIFSLDNNYSCLAPIETLITLFTIEYCKSQIEIILIKLKNNELICDGYNINVKNFKYEILHEYNCHASCELPHINLSDKYYIAGLCACLREIIKLSDSNNLLGHKNSCLSACSEFSVWTKYCEVDLISTLKTFDYNKNITNENNLITYKELPINMIRFENHLSQPLRLHNIHKYKMSKKYKNINIILEHIYAEGSFMTLSDLIIFICFHIMFQLLSKHDDIFKLLPLTGKWYERMLNNEIILKSLNFIPLNYYQNKQESSTQIIKYTLPKIFNESFYKNNTKPKSRKNKKYTRQSDIDNCFQLIKQLNLTISSDKNSLYYDNGVIIDWSTIPYEATPEGGDLPITRLEKKFQQLESLAIPILKLSKPGDIIVDFCSGSGHLGILIAYLLPKCNIILLENKEESINKSKIRVDKLKLNNVQFYQCNLDYFKGHFDIGISLHACGVATDLVIQQCIEKNSIFVSCPCCYGKLTNFHHIKYPRSKIFKETIDIKNYLTIGHAADQTHDEKNFKTKQGYECMNIIDTDRKLHAEQFGYTVHLTKLNPPTCTPKNNVIIGVPKRQNHNNYV